MDKQKLVKDMEIRAEEAKKDFVDPELTKHESLLKVTKLIPQLLSGEQP